MSEELLVRHCSPTLAGMKTGNLFSCTYKCARALRAEIRALNRRLSAKGLRILPLKLCGGKALIYVYRPTRLKADLARREAAELLAQHGYECVMPAQCIVHLMDRLAAREGFPHEIGLFLGYPPEDVRGFIENNAKCSKCVGTWKVYGDAEQAERLFAKYKKCTSVYVRQHANGNTIERLTVAV